MENIREKSQDDQDFLYSYGSVRSMIPNENYRMNYDLIFNSNKKQSFDDQMMVDVSSGNH